MWKALQVICFAHQIVPANRNQGDVTVMSHVLRIGKTLRTVLQQQQTANIKILFAIWNIRCLISSDLKVVTQHMHRILCIVDLAFVWKLVASLVMELMIYTKVVYKKAASKEDKIVRFGVFHSKKCHRTSLTYPISWPPYLLFSKFCKITMPIIKIYFVFSFHFILENPTSFSRSISALH